jgi:hypothetical protein
MINNEQLCCDREHSELIQETGLLRLEDADGYWVPFSGSGEEGDRFGDYQFKSVSLHESMRFIDVIASYRLDKILAVLKENLFESRPYNCISVRELSCMNIGSGVGAQSCSNSYAMQLSKDIQRAAMELTKQINNGTKELNVVNASAKLLHLLWSNGLVGNSPKEKLIGAKTPEDENGR